MDNSGIAQEIIAIIKIDLSVVVTEILWDHKFLSDVTGFGKLRCQIAHVF
jgi:hypothetical protein